MSAKKKEYLFVDGYNIINGWQSLKSISKISLDSARSELIETMAEYQSFTGIEVIIVFDAHLVKGSNQKEERVYGLTVVYTKERQTADSYIENKLDSMGRNKTVRVATSDWVEQQVVLGRGGTRISARELEIEVNNVKRAIKRQKSKKTTREEDDLLSGRLDKEILKKFEKMRRNQ
ncbi:NYN domain-containing protein [Clostridium sp. D2Q-11]|uniref:NYN domain-containing protein n=1 Tax=Anaeromonas frigoriresistens TaxID=2683708 RepID=A0A942UQT5_9FIRM|nr:NYN domain-containing protein [Anaeromonas frigoriresistens]MBS4536863.1 NYN domain-containing protein [Anaeromonas frigoriresistens]